MWESISEWFIKNKEAVAGIVAIFGFIFAVYRHFTSKASAKVMIKVSGNGNQVAGGDQTTTIIGGQVQGDKHTYVINKADPEFITFKVGF